MFHESLVSVLRVCLCFYTESYKCTKTESQAKGLQAFATDVQYK